MRLFFLFFQGGGQMRKWPAGSRTLPPQNGLKRDFPKKKKKNTPNHTVTAPSPRLQKRPQFFFLPFFCYFSPIFSPRTLTKRYGTKALCKKSGTGGRSPSLFHVIPRFLVKFWGGFCSFFRFSGGFPPKKAKAAAASQGGHAGLCTGQCGESWR